MRQTTIGPKGGWFRSALGAGMGFVTLLGCLQLTACTGGRTIQISYAPPTGGTAAHGARVITEKNCGSCHTIPGIRAANGSVGPPLIYFARRTFVGGEVPNTPENLVRWIRSPQSVEPKTAMPDLGLSDQDARDVAAYLYTLR